MNPEQGPNGTISREGRYFWRRKEKVYQEKGNPIEIIEKGDIIKCLPNVEHWHGATPSESMTHIAIGTNTNIDGAFWLGLVIEEDYSQE